MASANVSRQLGSKSVASANVSRQLGSKSVATTAHPNPHVTSTGPKRRGFTVLETLVAISISIGIGLIISQSFYDGWKAQLSQETYSELQQAARFSIDEVSEQIWNASSVVSATVADGTTYSTDADTLILRLPPLDNGGAIITGDDYIIFDKNSTSLLRLISPFGSSVRASLHTPLTLHKEVGALVFQYYNAAGTELIPGTNDLTATRRIKVTVTSTRLVNGRTVNRTLDTTVILRNKAV